MSEDADSVDRDYFEPDFITNGYRTLTPELQAYYILLVACGGRSDQFHQAFLVPPKDRIIENIPKSKYKGMACSVIRMDVHHVRSGPAYADYYYFPAQFEKAVRNYTHQYASKFTYNKRIRNSDFNKNPVFVTDLRKWNYRILYNSEAARLKNTEKGIFDSNYWWTCRIEPNIVHGNVGTLKQHDVFDDKDRAKRGAVLYSRCAEEIFSALDAPEWFLSGEVDFQALAKEPMPEKERNAREKKVITMLKAKKPDGKWQFSHRAIKIETGISSRGLNKIIEENGLERGNAGGRPKGMAKPRKGQKK